MHQAMLDTDTLSELLKAKNPRVLHRVAEYLAEHGRLAFSAMTYYEVVRGIRAVSADRQLVRFARLAATSDVLPVTLAAFDRAASLWATARAGGHPRNDADLIIAATAIENDRVLVTGNTSHFDWIPQLRVEDWR